MEIQDITLPQHQIVDFIKTKKYNTYNKVYITRFEETGKPEVYLSNEFNHAEKELLKDSKKFILKDNTDWPTYFIWVTIESTHSQTTPSMSPTKHFLTMNNKQHYHRCYVMDRLNQRGLLTNNVYSWTNRDIKHDGYTWLTNLSKHCIQESYSPDALITQYCIPKDAFNSTAISVVLESQCNNSTTFFTEKTFIPILHKRPLLVLGNFRHWENLGNYGFKKYPFINYDFDTEYNIVRRMDKFINEVERIVDSYSPQEITNMSMEVCHYNYNKLFDIYDKNIGKPSWARFDSETIVQLLSDYNLSISSSIH